MTGKELAEALRQMFNLKYDPDRSDEDGSCYSRTGLLPAAWKDYDGDWTVTQTPDIFVYYYRNKGVGWVDMGIPNRDEGYTDIAEWKIFDLAVPQDEYRHHLAAWIPRAQEYLKAEQDLIGDDGHDILDI